MATIILAKVAVVFVLDLAQDFFISLLLGILLKLALRQRIVAGMEQAIAAKEDRLRRLWSNRLAHQMRHLPPFDDVFREVLRTVRAADLPRPNA